MLLHLLVCGAVSAVQAFVPHVSTSGYPWVTDVTPGLNWATAADCGNEFILNTYYAMGEAQTLGLAAYHSKSIYDGPFEQFFGRGWDRHPKSAEDIFGNINASTWYPWRGDKQGRTSQRFQLSIRCKEMSGYQRCLDPNRLVLAYVTAGYGELGDQLTICPVLFDPSKSSRRRVPPRSLQSIEYSAPTAALGALISYGQVMLHEFMHVRRFQHPSVYGHTRCQEFAHLPGINGLPEANWRVVKNADNYAWWATAQYFALKWNLRPEKFRFVRAITPIDEGIVDEVNVAADDDFVKSVEDVPNPQEIDLPECAIDNSDPQSPQMVCDGQGKFEALPHDYPSDLMIKNMVSCPDSNPLLNLAQNPCDTKCNGVGYERCSPDLERSENDLEKHRYPFIKFSCYCKNTATQDSPCAGMKCGDPIKMKNGPMKDGKPRFDKGFRDPDGCVSNVMSLPPSAFACDVVCPNGMYNCNKEQPKFLGGNNAIKDWGVSGR
ncbi:MAG: hypothetical protein Q9180_004769 [Flavoplaca navasiana]